MKKLIKEELISKISINYRKTFIVLNAVIERQIKDKKHKSFNNLKFNNHERNKQS